MEPSQKFILYLEPDPHKGNILNSLHAVRVVGHVSHLKVRCTKCRNDFVIEARFDEQTLLLDIGYGKHVGKCPSRNCVQDKKSRVCYMKIEGSNLSISNSPKIHETDPFCISLYGEIILRTYVADNTWQLMPGGNDYVLGTAIRVPGQDVGTEVNLTLFPRVIFLR